MVTKSETPEAPKLGVYQAIAMIIDEMGKEGISKDKTASQGGTFKYRGIDQVYEALNPLLAKHGLIILPRVTHRQLVERVSSAGKPLFSTVLTVEFDFVSSLDGSRHTVCMVGEAMDSGDKSTSKAASIAYKYACFITFCIPVEGDDDPDAVVHDVAATKQPVKEQPKKWTQEIGRAEMARAESLLRASTTKKALDEVWNKQIDWTVIPKSWHEVLIKINHEVLDEIEKPAPKASVAPAFESADDDMDTIPF